MKKAAWLLVALVCVVVSAPAYGQFQIIQSGTGGSAGIISNATTYYVCAKGSGGTCVYNGDGGTVATPSDSTGCSTKATPCATLAGVATLLSGKYLTAVVTVQLADTAGTTTDCYTPNNVVFNVGTMGWSLGLAFLFDSSGGQGLTDQYPLTYLYIHGNDSTPGNVIITGATTCAGTTASVSNLLTFPNMNVRMRGATINYGAKNSVIFANSLALVEGMSATSDGAQNEYAFSNEHGVMRLGGTINCTGYYNCMNNDGSGSIMDDKTPLGCVTLTINLIVGSGGQGLILVQESAKEYISCGTYSFTGGGSGKTSVAWRAQDDGKIYFNDAASVTVTFNNTNLTPFQADLDSVISGNVCGTGIGNWTCTNTSSATIYAKSITGSRIYLGSNGNGKGSVITDNQALKGGQVSINWFANGPRQPLYTFTCSNTAASGALTGTGPNFFNQPCRIQANALQADSIIRFKVQGVYSGNAGDTITLVLKTCTTSASGCGGTTVTLGTSAAYTLTAVTNNYWEADFQIVCFTTGASGTLDTQGNYVFQIAASPFAVNNPIANTAAATVDTTVDEYLSISVAFSSASATNSITARQEVATSN
jgi:hypothetical protein